MTRDEAFEQFKKDTFELPLTADQRVAMAFDYAWVEASKGTAEYEHRYNYHTTGSDVDISHLDYKK